MFFLPFDSVSFKFVFPFLTRNMTMKTLRYISLSFTLVMLFGLAPANAQDVRFEKGIIRIIQSVEVPVPRAGIIRTLNLREGNIVSKDEVIGNLNDKSLRLQLEKARTQYKIAKRQSSDTTLVDYAKSTAAVAMAELIRAKNANRSVALAISDTELDRLQLVHSKSKLESDKAQIDLDVALLNQRLARVEIAYAENEIEQHTIKSPIDGLVVSVNKSAGEWVNAGEPVFKVVRINRLRVEGQVRVDKAIGIMINAKAKVEVELPDGVTVTREGEVVFVSPEVNTLNGNVNVWVEFENPDGKLRPGLQANVAIETAQSEKTPVANIIK